MLEHNLKHIEQSIPHVAELALGGASQVASASNLFGAVTNGC
jgi:fumarate hydratase class II